MVGWLVVCVLVGRKGRGWVEGTSRVFIYVDRERKDVCVESRELCVGQGNEVVSIYTSERGDRVLLLFPSSVRESRLYVCRYVRTSLL